MRVFRKKNPQRSFFCALCRAPRELRNGRHLSSANYIQILVLTAFVTMALFPWLEFKTLGSFFIFWGVFEASRKTMYRKELKCPYCGFDATWYRKDVRIARKHVEDFVKENPDARMFRSVSKDNDDNFIF